MRIAVYLHHKQAKSLCKRPAFLFEYFYDQQDTRPNLLTFSFSSDASPAHNGGGQVLPLCILIYRQVC